MVASKQVKIRLSFPAPYIVLPAQTGVKGPLLNPTVCYLTSLDLHKMVQESASSMTKFVSYLEQLLLSSHLSAQHCDEAKRQYTKFQASTKNHHSNEFVGFQPSGKLDTLFYERIGQVPEYQELW